MNGTSKTLILADWGNSSGRLYCVRGSNLSPEILETKQISGVKDTDDCADVFEKIARGWMEEHNASEAILCGAVTSNIGWVTTDYTPTPAQASKAETTKLVTAS